MVYLGFQRIPRPEQSDQGARDQSAKIALSVGSISRLQAMAAQQKADENRLAKIKAMRLTHAHMAQIQLH
jgi:hypothetical protein